MSWHPVKGAERYALQLVTPAGTYTVCRAKSQGRVVFTAWPPKPPSIPSAGSYDWRDHVHHSLATFDALDAAKRCCEEHAGVHT